MKLYGLRMPHSNGYYIPVNIFIYSYNISKPITFLMDTGCDITTVNYNDAINLNIHNVTGNTVKSRGIGGIHVDNVELYQCSIYYYLNNHTSFHSELLDIIHISKPIITKENYDAVMSLPSLLGMDFLQRYRICFDGKYVILEK